jgi:hypothetical protein
MSRSGPVSPAGVSDLFHIGEVREGSNSVLCNAANAPLEIRKPQQSAGSHSATKRFARKVTSTTAVAAPAGRPRFHAVRRTRQKHAAGGVFRTGERQDVFDPQRHRAVVSVKLVPHPFGQPVEPFHDSTAYFAPRRSGVPPLTASRRRDSCEQEDVCRCVRRSLGDEAGPR